MHEQSGEFLKNLTSGSWWLSVAFVALILHLAASYLKLAIDRGLVQVYGLLRRRSNLRRVQDSNDVAALVGDEYAQVMQALAIIWGTIGATAFLMFAALFVGLAAMVRTMRTLSSWLTIV